MPARKVLLFVLIVFGFQDASSQELVFGQPEKLGSQINSDDEELGAMLSDDGKTLYFTRAFHANNTGGKFAGTDIWVSKKDENGNWLPASNAGRPWNNKQSNSVIGINHDHTVVYLLNAYSNKSGIAFSKLFSGAWGEPEFIPIPGINRDDFVGFYVSPAFDVILISMKGKDSYGEEDLYVSLKDSFGKWTEPRNLGTTINTKGFEISPFLSLDKKRLFFSSNGHPGFGDADIYYCDRLFDSWETWSVPKNLGERVNSKMYDAFFYFYSDSVAFFASNREGNRSKLFDIKTIKEKQQAKIEIVNQYLSNTEVIDLLGIDPVISFEKSSAILSDGQKQKLLIIGTALRNRPELRCFLVAIKNPNSTNIEVYQSRLLAVLDYLKSAGIEGSRISLSLEEDSPALAQEREYVKLKLYR